MWRRGNDLARPAERSGPAVGPPDRSRVRQDDADRGACGSAAALVGPASRIRAHFVEQAGARSVEQLFDLTAEGCQRTPRARIPAVARYFGIDEANDRLQELRPMLE